MALAEYELVRELRNSHAGNAFAQIGQIFVGASVAIAAIAALAGMGDEMPAVHLVTIGGVGVTTLGLGLLLYRRYIGLILRRYEYDLCLNAIRTFMVDRLPEIRPYLLLPDLRESADRTAPSVGIARVMTSCNSLLAGFGPAVAVWAVRPNPWLATAAALQAVVASATLHLIYERRAITRKRRYMADVLRSRGWSVEV